MRWSGLIPSLGVALASIVSTPPADQPEGGWLRRATREVRELAEGALERWKAEAEPARAFGLWLVAPDGERVEVVRNPDRDPPFAPADAPGRVVVLIHGLDEPGAIFDELVDALRAEGHAVALLEYPDDQPIARSTDLLIERLRALRTAGVAEIDLVAHSMGGLIARSALARDDAYAGRPGGHEDLPRVSRLVMVATPHLGSPWARARVLSEIREQAARWIDAGDWRELLGFDLDGLGEAGTDLLPDSAFLADLNTHEIPPEVHAAAIVGALTPPGAGRADWLRSLPIEDAGLDDATIDAAIGEFGDGVVSDASASTCPGLDEVVRVRGSHRGILRTMKIEDAYWDLVGEAPAMVPPAIPEILRLLRR